MGEINTNWDKAILPDWSDMSGDRATHRGSDPTIDLSGSSGLSVIWDGGIVPTPSGEQSANSVSGLPATPNRWLPAEDMPDPPDLTRRNPGTIDKK